jgi:hypothetical protein
VVANVGSSKEVVESNRRVVPKDMLMLYYSKRDGYKPECFRVGVVGLRPLPKSERSERSEDAISSCRP